MTVTAPVSAVRAPFRVNDSTAHVPAVAMQQAIERWPGRVFFFVPQRGAFPGFTEGAKGHSLRVLAARERAGRVEILTDRDRRIGARSQWREVPQKQQEGYIYAR
jgi:hypothetical protein